MTFRPESPVFYVQWAPHGVTSAERIDVTDAVLSLTYDEEESAADKCTLTVDNYDLRNFDNPVFKKGATFIVAWGYPGDMSPAREVVVGSVKGFQTLTVEGLSKSILMNKVGKQRVFEGKRRSDVAQQIAQENGYDEEFQEIEETKVVLPTITQANLTDAQFLAQLALKEGFEFYTDFDGFHFHRRKTGQRPWRSFVWFHDREGEIKSISVDSDVTAIPGGVTVAARDPLSKTDVSATSTAQGGSGPYNNTALAETVEVIDPRTRTSTTVLLPPVYDDAMGSATTVPSAVAEGDAGAAEAAAKAQGMATKAASTTYEITMEVFGDPQLRAKKTYGLEGVGVRLSGNYYCKKVNTKIDVGGVFAQTLTLRRSGSSGGGGAGAGGGAPPAPSKDAVNAQAAGDPNALEPRDIIDPRTKQVITVYFPPGGGSD